MTEYIFQCRGCERNSRVNWDGSRDQVQFYCPHCGRTEIETFRILIEDYPSTDIFYKETPVNIRSHEQYNPLRIGETEIDLSPTQRQKGKTRMKTLTSLDVRQPEEDSLLKRARRILSRILGGSET